MTIEIGEDMWDAHDAKFGVLHAESDLYVREQYNDYKMTNDCSLVEQAHEIRNLSISTIYYRTSLLPSIIAKLPPSWRNFATSPKHERQEFSVVNLTSTLDGEEKAREKDTRGRVSEGNFSTNLVHKKNFHSHNFENMHEGKKLEGTN